MSDGNEITANVTVVNTGNIANLAIFKVGDDWEIFCERIEQFFLANRVEDGRKISVLLTSVSEDVYKILRNICHPDKPSSKTYNELIELLSGQFKPKVSVYRKRVNFDVLRQKEESINEWFVKVKKGAAECDFGTMLEARVLDKFVVGLRPGPILDRLCEESATKPLKDMVEIALVKEATLKETRQPVSSVYHMHSDSKKFMGHGLSVNRRGSEKPKEVSGGKPDSQRNKVSDKPMLCFACGDSNHVFKMCKFKKYTCSKCKKKGHIAKVCKAQLNNVDIIEGEVEFFNMDVNIFSLDGSYVAPISINAFINEIPITMEVDTGAGLSCLPYDIYKNKFFSIALKPSNIKIKVYHGPVVSPKGQIDVDFSIHGVTKRCKFLIIEGATKALIGRDIWKQFVLSLNEKGEVLLKGETVATTQTRTEAICQVTSSRSDRLENVMSRFSNLFKNELGTYRDELIKLELNENVLPIFRKPAPIPYAFRERVQKELERLEREGVIKKVSNSSFGTPLVPVVKANGIDVRVCANYKITINKYLKDVNYPLPRIEDIFVALQGGQQFTKLDFLNAYNQLVLDEETSELLAWSTPYGIYKVNRLPYGTKPACSLFQGVVEKVLQGCKGTVNYLDDIVVTGKDEAEHLDNLVEVLTRLDRAGFRLNKKKCVFFQDKICYLGHTISAQGLEKDNKKIEAILKTPRPRDRTEVRAFVGMVNYYSKFIPNLAQNLKPLYSLLEKDSAFTWSKACDQAFQFAKESITSDCVLIHFDANKPLRLACDSSEYGIGSVLLHVMPDGMERPISFVSRVLTKAEKNYSIVHKEALSIYWAVTKFFEYLAGRKFEIVTDHKPLQTLFGEHKSLPKMAAGRLQRWSLFLSGFDYTIRYIKGTENVKADALSRLPLPMSDSVEEVEYDYLNFLESVIAIDTNKIRSETRRDATLGKIFNFIRHGFPNHTNDDLLKPYFSRKSELSIENEIILWGYRVVVPIKLRSQLLAELHSTHEGVSKMKANARSYFWWPSLDKDIERVVSECRICATSRVEPNKATLIPCVKSDYFYERVHADFLGPIRGKMVLIIIDTYAKWPEAFIMKSTDAVSTIEKFRECFARFGLPKVVVTDNGPQFCAEEFSKFLSFNGIKHQTAPPYHPATNGFAENAVKNFKSSILKAFKDETNSDVSFQTLVSRYLFHYRNSVHITTGVTPSSLVFKHKIRNRFDLLTERNTRDEKSVLNYQGKRNKSFKEGDIVLCRDYRNPNKKAWVEAKIDEVLSDRIYLCKVLKDGFVWKRHINQILSSNLKPETDSLRSNFGDVPNSFNDSNADNFIPDRAYIPSFKSNLPNCEFETNSDRFESELNKDIVELGEESKVLDNSKLFENTTKNLLQDSDETVKRLSLNINDRPKRLIKAPVRLDL